MGILVLVLLVVVVVVFVAIVCCVCIVTLDCSLFRTLIFYGYIIRVLIVRYILYYYYCFLYPHHFMLVAVRCISYRIDRNIEPT